jgi:hypothetical protein
MLGEIQNRECVLCVIKSEETRNWCEELVDKRFTSTEPEIGIRRICKLKPTD